MWQKDSIQDPHNWSSGIGASKDRMHLRKTTLNTQVQSVLAIAMIQKEFRVVEFLRYTSMKLCGRAMAL